MLLDVNIITLRGLAWNWLPSVPLIGRVALLALAELKEFKEAYTKLYGMLTKEKDQTKAHSVLEKKLLALMEERERGG